MKQNTLMQRAMDESIVDLLDKIHRLKQHINHIRKVHDYQDQQGNEATLQLRVAIVNASEFSRRE